MVALLETCTSSWPTRAVRKILCQGDPQLQPSFVLRTSLWGFCSECVSTHRSSTAFCMRDISSILPGPTSPWLQMYVVTKQTMRRKSGTRLFPAASRRLLRSMPRVHLRAARLARHGHNLAAQALVLRSALLSTRLQILFELSTGPDPCQTELQRVRAGAFEIGLAASSRMQGRSTPWTRANGR